MEKYGNSTIYEIAKRLDLYIERENELIARETKLKQASSSLYKLHDEFTNLMNVQVEASKLSKDEYANEGWHQAWIHLKQMNDKLVHEIESMKK